MTGASKNSQKSLSFALCCYIYILTDPPRLGPPGYAHQGGCFIFSSEAGHEI